MLKGLIRYETRMGQSYETSGGRITPFSKALIIRLPKAPVGLVWNRPASLLVTREDGQEQVIPVVDITRMVVWSLSGAILAFALIFRGVTHSRRRE